MRAHPGLVGIGLVLLATLVPAAHAQGSITVNADTASFRFAEAMDFTLDARSAASIDSVVLHYTVGDSPVRNRRIPTFSPGTSVRASHHEKLVRGAIPPTTEITWWWTVQDRAGGRLETAPRTDRYLDTRFSWQHTAGSDVRVWWYGAPEGFAQDLERRARAAVTELAADIGTTPDRTIDIVTYQSREDMLGALVNRGDVFEARLSTLGARVAPGILLLLAGEDNPELRDVLRHELTHLVLHLHLDKEYLTVPGWLDEGLAMYEEGPLAGDEAETLRAAVADDRLMSLRSLTSFPGQAQLVPLAYAESRDIVAFLIESHGQARFQQLLDHLASGELDTDEALRSVYGQDQLGLYQSYRSARGLRPAATAAPGATRIPARRESSGGGPCAGAALIVPALVAAGWSARRRRAA